MADKKFLPLAVTKGKVVSMYLKIHSEKNIRGWISEIQKETRGKYYNKGDHDLSLFEWLIFLKIWRAPPGYYWIFNDFEPVDDKMKEFPEIENFT